jgi:hypothetical protein
MVLWLKKEFWVQKCATRSGGDVAPEGQEAERSPECFGAQPIMRSLRASRTRVTYRLPGWYGGRFQTSWSAIAMTCRESSICRGGAARRERSL